MTRGVGDFPSHRVTFAPPRPPYTCWDARYRAITRYRTPTRYHAEKEGGASESIVHIPLMVGGEFRGIAELIWNERADLVFDL